jgi:uncharacterized delta-60 repeat protein
VRRLAIGVLALLAAAPGAAAAPGDLDPSFGSGGVAQGSAGENDSLAIQPDGKLVLGGGCGVDYVKACVVRLLSDGSRDPAFGGDGAAEADLGPYRYPTVLGVAVQGDGRILGVGRTTAWAHYPARALAVRFLPDGRLDPSYGSGGIALHDLGDSDGFEGVEGVAIQPDGSAVVAGSAHHAGGHWGVVARLRLDGTLDPAFGANGRVLLPLEANSGELTSIALEPDGRIVVAGEDLASGLVLRLLPDGRFDSSFGSGDGIVRLGDHEMVLRDVKRQADAKLVVAGWYSPGGGEDSSVYAARLLPDGALDGSFGDGGVVLTRLGSDDPQAIEPVLIATGDALALQANGKIVVGGWMRRWDPAGYEIPMVLLRYEEDGDPDPTFAEGGRVTVPDTDAWNFASLAAALQPDGRLVVSGHGRVRRFLGDPAPGGAPVPVPEPGPPPAAGTGDPGTGGGTGETSEPPPPLATLGGVRLSAVAGRRVRIRGTRVLLPVRAACPASAPHACSLRVRAAWRAAGGPRRYRPLGASTLRVAPGARRTISIRTTRGEARRLRRANALRLRLAVRSAGTTRVLTLRARR